MTTLILARFCCAVEHSEKPLFCKQLSNSTVEFILVERVRIDPFTKEKRQYDVNESDSELEKLYDQETYSLVQSTTNSLKQTIWRFVFEYPSAYAISISQPGKVLVLDVCEHGTGILILYLNKGEVMLDEIHKKTDTWKIYSSLSIGTWTFSDLAPEATITSSVDGVIISIKSKDTGRQKIYSYSQGKVKECSIRKLIPGGVD